MIGADILLDSAEQPNCGALGRRPHMQYAYAFPVAWTSPRRFMISTDIDQNRSPDMT